MKQNNSAKFILVFVILLAVAASVVAVQLGFNPFVNADPALVPEQILVTNQGSNSTTISFVTFAKKANSIIKFGLTATQMDQISYDVNNLNNSATYESNIHYHILTGLTADSTYYYKIVVGGQEQLNNGVPYQFFTGKVGTTPPTPNSVYGKVIGGSTECIINTHALHDTSLSTPLSEFISANGTYSFDVNEFKDRTTLANFPQDSRTQILVFVTCADNKRGGVVSDLLNKLPDITVSANYSVSQYSINLTSLDQSGITPTISTTIKTPTPTIKATISGSATTTPTVRITGSVSATVSRTLTPTPTILESITPTPTSLLPKSGIREDAPIYAGIIFVLFGFLLSGYLKKQSSRI